MSGTVGIYVAAHVPAAVPDDSGYRLIQVGHAGAERTFSETVDSTGDNISHLNPDYCELTAHYWIWKNSPEGIVGVMHYRRYLVCPETFGPEFSGKLISSSVVRWAMSYFDILVPDPFPLSLEKTGRPLTVREAYDLTVSTEHLPVVREVIADLSADYMEEFDMFMKKTDMVSCNILIARREVFNRYCEWLFPVLFELERRLPLRNHENYKPRILGHVSERLLNIWLLRNIKEIATGYLPMVRVADSGPVQAGMLVS